MMSLTAKGSKLFEKLPEINSRALEVAIDRTVIDDCKPAVYDEMLRVFSNPTRYTLNSLKVTPTIRHNMVAYIWFKEPDRMGQHYLLPQVEGGPRKLKGFERALGGKMFIPGIGARLNKHGNISVGQIRQVLSVLGRAERTAGYTANISARSSKRNKRQRDYVYMPNGRGGLLPGVYQRKAKGGRGSASGTHRAMQRGKKRNVIRARGLVPILLVGKQFESYRPLLDFYGIVQLAYNRGIGRKYVNALGNLLNG